MRTLMKILKNLFGNNTKISADNIAVNTDNGGVTLDNCVVIESGSNENGDWIKYSNGDMIVSQKYTDSKKVYVSMGSLKRVGLKAPPDFPISFKEPPTVQITLHNAWLVWLLGIENTPSVTNATNDNFIPIASAEERTATDVEIHILAKGKWK